MSNQCFKPMSPCSFRKECERVSQCEYLQLRQAINNLLQLAEEDSDGSHIPEQEMIDLKLAFQGKHIQPTG